MLAPTANRPWLSAYPPGVPADLDVDQCPSLVHLLETSFQRYASRTAYSFMGKDLRYAQVDSLSQAFAAYLQGLGLLKGERVAIMTPNVPQYPVAVAVAVAVAGILRAGMVVVNVNPPYTVRELEHPLKDSGAKAIVGLENFAATLAQCIEKTPVKHVGLKELSKHRFHSFPAVNTLFNALANHPHFGTADWSHLKVSVGGGMAVQSGTAKLWLEKTGCSICEGYGLSETSPSATCNPVTNTAFTGTIGVPLPGTWLKCLDDDGHEVPLGQPGEIAIKGPQVMAGYWQRPDETAKVMTPDGYFKSGDIGTLDVHGHFKIVDRKKNMILCAGFNVYPNEIEDVVSTLSGVLECAAVGVPDEKAGEAIKLVIVKKDAALTEAQVRAHCRAHLTGYKQPKVMEFRTERPKTPVGKVLRRALR
jgi:acyl-CoA synthetase (AMP-forming)/AMP-acid ligase II